MVKTVGLFDWENGYRTRRKLSRSFNTLQEAQKFAETKLNSEIYKSKGKFKVEWTLIKDNNK